MDEVLQGHRPQVWVSDLYSAQRNHPAEQWQVCLAHQLRDCEYAIEGFNAALRPFLYVHKGVTQGFLDLFRAYYNLRTRRWGRLKGTSAHQCLTGQTARDGLMLLGFPPSVTLH